MSTTVVRLFQNTSFSFLSNVMVLSRPFLFVLVVRYVGVADGGIYSLAVTYSTIFLTLSSLGLNELLTREVAKDRPAAGQFLINFSVLRFLGSIVIYIGLLFLVNGLVTYSSRTVWVITLLTMGVFPDGLSAICRSLFTSFERQSYPTWVDVIATTTRVAGTIVALKLGAGINSVVLISVGSSFLALALNLVIVTRYLKQQNVLVHWTLLDPASWKRQLYQAFPFALIETFLTVEYNIDVVLLSLFLTEAEIGWYSTARTILTALKLFPQAYRMAVYPVMSRLFSTSRDGLEKLYVKSLKYLGVLALPMAAGTAILSPHILEAVYGENLVQASFALRILVWVFVFNSLNVPNSRLMLVSNHQSQAALFLAGSMVINMILNLLLVPWLGISGAATARLISALFFFLPNFLFVFRHIQPIKFSLGFLKPVAATLGMVGIVWWMQDLPLLLVVALGGILYLILLLSFRVISPDERRLLGNIFHHSILGNVEDVL